MLSALVAPFLHTIFSSANVIITTSLNTCDFFFFQARFIN